MGTQEDPMIESLRRLFEQHWLHCRHLEYERAGFASIYAAIVGGVLAYISVGGMVELWPLYFLMALTLVGLGLTARWTYAFEYHRRKIKETASALGINAAVDIPAKCIFTILRTKYLFPLFYVVVLVGLIFLVVTN